MAVATKKTKVAASVEPSPPSEPLAYIDQIGATAGAIWHALNEQGPLTLAKLTLVLKDHPKEMVLHAIGWLAREGKLEVTDASRTKKFALK